MTTITHPIRTAAHEVRSTLKSVADANPTFLGTEEKQEVLTELSAARAQLDELVLRVMEASDDVAAAASSRDIGAWMAANTRRAGGEMRADACLATALDRRWQLVATGMREGRVNLPQAKVIARALEALPEDLDSDTVLRAEAALVRYAHRFGPKPLARLGRKILEVVAPDLAEEAEAKRLAAEERSAREKTRLSLRAHGDGTTRLSGRIPDAAATRLACLLEALINPRRQTARPDAPLRKEPYPRRMGWAFCSLLEGIDPDRMPVHGGDATTLVVTIGLDALRDQVGTAMIGSHLPGDPVDQISAHEARRMACSARIIPAVLGGMSEVLDLGRAQRLFSKAQRKALLLRDGACRAEGCDVPGTWCEAHHWLAWADGGATDLDNGLLLCAHHHHRVHDPGVRADRMANGDVRFARRR